MTSVISHLRDARWTWLISPVCPALRHPGTLTGTPATPHELRRGQTHGTREEMTTAGSSLRNLNHLSIRYIQLLLETINNGCMDMILAYYTVLYIKYTVWCFCYAKNVKKYVFFNSWRAKICTNPNIADLESVYNILDENMGWNNPALVNL